jgi:hypothetical protein
MSLPGERTKPASGVKGSKGGKGSQPRLRLPKMPAPPEASDLQEQSSIYLRERNKQMRAKRLRAEMELAFDRNQLIEKALVEKQLAYMLIGMRQKMLALPEKMRVQFGPERFTHEMAQAAKVLVAEILQSIAQLPEAANLNWLEKLEEDDK